MCYYIKRKQKTNIFSPYERGIMEKNEYINEYEDWVYDNMMDESSDEPDDISDSEEPISYPEEEPEHQIDLQRIRGDSTLNAKVKRTRHSDLIMKVLLVIIVAVIVSALFTKVYYSPVTVIGSSMYPTLNGGDILITTTSIKKEEISYDTIICFEKDSPQTLIKRVIGLPGDTISFSNGKVFVNGKQRNDDFSDMTDFPEETITLEDDEYYCLGDNRNNSVDSRRLGPVKFSEITAIVRYNSTQRKKDMNNAFKHYEEYMNATSTDSEDREGE